MRDALSFGVTRIGHGHHIYDDISLWEPAIACGVTLEICPTSNIQCHTQPSYREHPAKELLDEDLQNNKAVFPDFESLENCEVFRYLGDEADGVYNSLWKDVKSQ